MRSSAGWCQGIRPARQLSIPLRAFHYPPTRRPLSCKTPFALNPWIIPIASFCLRRHGHDLSSNSFLVAKTSWLCFLFTLIPRPCHLWAHFSNVVTWLDKISVEKQVGRMWIWYFWVVCPFKCVRFERPWLHWSGWFDWEGLSNRGQSKMAQSVRARVMHCHTPDTSLTPWLYWLNSRENLIARERTTSVSESDAISFVKTMFLGIPILSMADRLAAFQLFTKC